MASDLRTQVQVHGCPRIRDVGGALMSLVIEAGTRIADDLDPTWHGVCRVDDLEPSWGEVALVEGHQVAVFRLEGDAVHAVEHWDPHTGAPVMARGIVGSKGERATVASPLHKEVYDLQTGECYSNPSLHLRTYASRVLDGVIEVAIAR